VTEVGADPIDAAAFANLLEMTGGDVAFVDELVDTYLEEGASLVDRLRTAAATGAGDDLLRAAHSLKSSSQNVGALPLGELCRGLETDARTGTVPDARARSEEIGAAFDEARLALLAERERRAG
jgi:HPt (histidine-containing phosphotransfer) domain-containing protein